MKTASKIALVLGLVGVSASVYAIKKATVPKTLREMPPLALVPAAPDTRGPIPNEATLEQELKLVHGAQTALKAGDTSRAFSLLYEHATRFPKGKLTQQRQVTHVVALCLAGKANDARDELAEFLLKNPGSPLAEQAQGRRCAE